MICFSPIRVIEHIQQFNYFTLCSSVCLILNQRVQMSSTDTFTEIVPVTQNRFISELLVRLHVLQHLLEHKI